MDIANVLVDPQYALIFKRSQHAHHAANVNRSRQEAEVEPSLTGISDPVHTADSGDHSAPLQRALQFLGRLGRLFDGLRRRPVIS